MEKQDECNVEVQKNGKAIASLVLGILSCVGAITYMIGWLIGLVCGIIAIVFGAKAKKQKEQRGIAIAGFVLGIIGTSLCSITILLTILLFASFAS